MIFLAIVDQRPRVLNLLDACELFLDFRRDVVRRRTAYELRKAEARAHILEGFVIALDHLDEVIALIRAARTPEEARSRASSPDSPSARSRPTRSSSCSCSGSPASSGRRSWTSSPSCACASPTCRTSSAPRTDRRDHRRGAQGIREAHGDPRRTEIVDAANEIAVEDLIADEDVAISITHSGYIKRTSITSYRAQRRGGRGQDGDEDEGRGLRRPTSSSPPPTPTSSSSRTGAGSTG